MRRTALEDFELDGQRIRAGAKAVMKYLSGDRDETVFDDPVRLCIDRPNARAHLACGFGIHRRMGNRLAELQLQVLREEIVNRLRKVKLAGEAVRLPDNGIGGLKDVPVRLQMT